MASEAQLIGYELLKTGLLVSFRITCRTSKPSIIWRARIEFVARPSPIGRQ